MRDSWRRYALGRSLLEELGFFEGALQWYRQEAAREAELALVHDPAYIERVRAADAAGVGLLDYGDTPAYPGVLHRALLAVGGTLLGARLVASGQVAHAFNPGGGLHHARRDIAGGFCVFNDVAIAIRVLQREFGLRRLAVIDCDGHHGDGTQALLYGEPVLYISLHRYDGRFYPRTGTTRETGEGEGSGYTLNLPLPRGTGDAAYLAAVEQAVLPRLAAYQPDLIFAQVGADGHHGDPLVHLGLSVSAFGRLGALLHEAAHALCGGRLVAVAGGGYKPDSVAWCWATFLASLTGPPSDEADARLTAYAAADTPRLANPEADGHVLAMVSELRKGGALEEPG
ncbi:MAG: histone deacetylase family protein [Chloroflexota bacterium]